jgi:hypothetical protein
LIALVDQYSSQLCQQSVAEMAWFMSAVTLTFPEPPAIEVVVVRLVVSFACPWLRRAETLLCSKSPLIGITVASNVVFDVIVEDVSRLMSSPAAT